MSWKQHACNDIVVSIAIDMDIIGQFCTSLKLWQRLTFENV